MTSAARVRPMTAEEFEPWIAVERAAYAAELAAASGGTLEDAVDRAERQLRGYLPDGIATEGALLLRVLDADDVAVGVLWLGPHPQRTDAGWVYDIEIEEERRGEGLGRAAMLAAEQAARDAGWSALGLHVFGHNDRARALYDSLGYEVVSTAMTKSLAC